MKKKNTIQRIGIAILGAIGGLLIGKAIFDKKKSQIQTQNKSQQQQFTNIEDYDRIQQLMTCPISLCIMTDPYIIPECGHNFQKRDIVQFLKKYKSCPVCRKETQLQSLKPNFQLRSIINEYQKKNKIKQKEIK